MDKETERDMTPSPMPQNWVVKLTSTRESLRQLHKTFPEQAPKKPHPSHFNTTPESTTDDIDSVSPLSISPPNEPTHQSTEPRKRVRPLRRSSTIELHENPAYHPEGGPDYLKILAKYDLFGTDERHGPSTQAV
jgi:hypothetical protein